MRIGPSLVAVVGVAGVVAVFIAVLSIGEGFRRTMASTGAPDNVLIMRAGTDSELSSAITRAATRIVEEAPGVSRGAGGPVASAELFVIVDVPKRTTGTDANVPLRGVQPAAFDVRRGLRIVEGRRFEPGRNEVIVGRAAHGQFAGLDVGSVLRWGENEWRVVGIFETGGSIAESEIWCDAGVLGPAYRRGDTFQSVAARLESPEAFQGFKDALTGDPRLDVMVVREPDYYAEQSITLRTIISRLGYLIAGLMGVGAVFGALNTMYSAVATRSREIATLRALGFGGVPIVCSVIVEALLLCGVGGALGGLLAYAIFNGLETSTLNFQSFSQVSFAFAVTPGLLLQGITYATILGLIGGLLPAIRAARLPIVNALREL